MNTAPRPSLLDRFRQGYASARRASVVDRQIANGPDQIREGLKLLRSGGIATLRNVADHAVGLLRGLRCSAGHKPLRGRDVSEHKVLQGLDTIEERGVQSQSPSLSAGMPGYADDEQRIADRIAVHRLSGTPE